MSSCMMLFSCSFVRAILIKHLIAKETQDLHVYSCKNVFTISVMADIQGGWLLLIPCILCGSEENWWNSLVQDTVVKISKSGVPDHQVAHPPGKSPPPRLTFLPDSYCLSHLRRYNANAHGQNKQNELP